MNDPEARMVLLEALEKYRFCSFAQLRDLVKSCPQVQEREGPTGVKYQLEFEAFWDGGKGGPVRVMGNIDDMGRRAFAPLSESFIMAPDGSFVGE